MEANILSTMLIAFLISAVLFLLLREFFCWYYKINEIAGILRRIEAKLPNLTGVSDVKPEIEQPLISKENLLMKEYRERYTTYRTGKLIAIQSKGLSSYSKEILSVVSEILKERKERGEE
jgi:hypothetical protein